MPEQGIYNVGLKELSNGTIVWGTTTLKVLLLKATYTFNRDDETVSALSSHELTSTNYVRKTLAGFSSTVDQLLDRSYLRASSVTWSAPAIAAGQTIAYAVVYRDTGDDATAPPIFCFKVVATDPNGVAYTVQWNSLGLCRVKDATV